ncbi:copper amine oxidase N-terminal domain-containing protein [Paenibacillus sp. CAA11]|uniref:copper amine oxidase N-terminal domain-containing protein n=1 Tax=Paenibacillus sp. CAA11 TaxID=1532905 RepID=UPI00131ED6D7|nr:copper amine oxidase N-terminal domain-containing protein [Paenibacillus sp. CAA11]
MKRFILALLGALLLVSFHEAENASANSLPEKSNVYLKAGKFYVLYTKPASPFVDENHRLLVPLRTFEDLFGGQVTYAAATKTAELTWLNHKFMFEIGSTNAQMDGHSIKMDTQPILKNGAMFLPIRIFLDQAGLKSHWDLQENVLIIEDEKILTGEPFQSFDGNDLFDKNKDGAFRVNNYAITNNSNNTFKLTISATNITGKTIPNGKADIHPLVSFGAEYGGFATDSFSRPVYPPIKEIGKQETITVSQSFPQKEVDYIITVARVFAD